MTVSQTNAHVLGAESAKTIIITSSTQWWWIPWWHEDAATLITRLARQLASHTGKEVDEQIKHLFQRMGILLMRGNSALINRTPDYADAEVDGDLDFDI